MHVRCLCRKGRHRLVPPVWYYGRKNYGPLWSKERTILNVFFPTAWNICLLILPSQCVQLIFSPVFYLIRYKLKCNVDSKSDVYLLIWRHAGTSSGNCQETETSIVLACPLHDSLSKTILLWHLRGWKTLWSAEKMLNGQHQRVNLPGPRQNCSQWPPAVKTGRGSLLNSSFMAPRRPNRLRDWTELNWTDLHFATIWLSQVTGHEISKVSQSTSSWAFARV